jgi:hypothetical protein
LTPFIEEANLQSRIRSRDFKESKKIFRIGTPKNRAIQATPDGDPKDLAQRTFNLDRLVESQKFATAICNKLSTVLPFTFKKQLVISRDSIT